MRSATAVPLRRKEGGRYFLTVVWIDGGTDTGVKLDELFYKTRAARMKAWNAVPVASGVTPFYLEMRDERHVLEQAKAISAESVEVFLGEPVETLLEREQRILPSVAELKRALKKDKQ